MSEEAQLILNAMQSAVIEELQRKAKLGYKAVIAGRRGEGGLGPVRGAQAARGGSVGGAGIEVVSVGRGVVP